MLANVDTKSIKLPESPTASGSFYKNVQKLLNKEGLQNIHQITILSYIFSGHFNLYMFGSY